MRLYFLKNKFKYLIILCKEIQYEALLFPHNKLNIDFEKILIFSFNKLELFHHSFHPTIISYNILFIII